MGEIKKPGSIFNAKKFKFKKLLILLGILAVIALAIGGFLFWASKIIKTPNSTDGSTVSFVIEQGEGSGDIATRLSDAGLLKNRFVFVLYLNQKSLGDSVQAGEYKIPKNLTMIELAEVITRGKTASSKLTIPEGWTIDKIADRVAANGWSSKADFLKAAEYNPAKHKYEFLAGLKAGDSLEGFLYPDTYQLSIAPTADEIVGKMLANFDKKFTADLRAKVKKTNMTTYEVVTLASIVEREVAKPEDRKLVASVFLNRLNIDMALESCATIQYISGENKKQFTYEETRVASPYNTYINRGLPPGPIGNPSIDAIKAVLEPTDSNYLYFLSADGQTYFSKTLDEHNAKKAKYLR